MEFQPTEIPDVVLIRPKVFSDARGYFLETWEAQKFAQGGVDQRFVQDNHSHSVRHTLRGMHYQREQAQGKLVRAVTGKIFDVAIDVRRSSPSFGRWVGVVLSDENKHLLWVPPGFAHGFLVLSESADVVYKCTDFYAPAQERTIRWNDPELNITWPLPPGASPVLAPRDASASGFRDADHYP